MKHLRKHKFGPCYKKAGEREGYEQHSKTQLRKYTAK